MPVNYLTITASPKEVAKLVTSLAADTTPISTVPLEYKSNECELLGKVTIDRRGARAHYAAGALSYGPVEIDIFIDHLKVFIDWHRALNIPKEACIHLKDPCGNTIFKECVHFDLGTTVLKLFDNSSLRLKPDFQILDLSFRDSNPKSDYYVLTADVPFAGQLFDLLISSVIEGALDKVADFVKRLLKSVFGNGEIAKLLIKIIINVFKIIELAVDFIGKLIRLLLQPLDELLHKIFGAKLEIDLQDEGFPKRLALIAKKGNRPEVTVSITQPPRIDLIQSGLVIEVKK